MTQVTVKQLAPNWYVGTAEYAGKRLAWFAHHPANVLHRAHNELARRCVVACLARREAA